MREEDLIAVAEDAGFAKAAVMNTEDLEFEHYTDKEGYSASSANRTTVEIMAITMDVHPTAEPPKRWRTELCSTAGR